MKHNIILLAVFLTAGITVRAQVTSGVITYDQVTQFKMDVPAEAAQFKNMLPREVHTAHALTFSPAAAVYGPAPKAAPAQQSTMNPEEGQTIMVRVAVTSDADIIYTDLKTALVTEQKDLFSKKFLITDNAAKRAWRQTGRQKTILNFPCQEVSVLDKDTTTAWFTTAIPIAAGPQNIAGLPGMILEVSQTSDHGEMIITATHVAGGLNGKEMPGPPTKGKVVSRD